MARPLVGITWSDDLVDRSSRPGENALRYADLLLRGGMLPVLVTPGDGHAVVERLDGLLLPGGPDINPARYGREPEAHLGAVDDDLDALELRIVEKVLERALPVLGICRGQQLVNVALGGTLRQHVEDHPQWDGDPAAPAHLVALERGTLLQRALGADTVAVNSGHHQAIDEVAAALTVSAHAGDGVVEAVESGTLRVLAVQWHPEERREDEVSWRLVTAFREWL